jgi:hypothetical protein
MFVRSIALSTAALILGLTAGCGLAPQSVVAGSRTTNVSALSKGGGAFVSPKSKEEFAAAAKAKGVKLSEEDLAMIQAERQVKPSGIWAPRPAEKLTAEQNLDVHFKKHGHEFRPALTSAAAYMAQGNAAGNGERGTVRFFFDITSFDKGYQTHVVRWVPQTHDFMAFRTDGAETTYYQNDPQPNRFIEVPTW